ncbi:MAG: hypothetical protein U0746_19000 [Gemmataceae bacterium]
MLTPKRDFLAVPAGDDTTLDMIHLPSADRERIATAYGALSGRRMDRGVETSGRMESTLQRSWLPQGTP